MQRAPQALVVNTAPFVFDQTLRAMTKCKQSVVRARFLSQVNLFNVHLLNSWLQSVIF